ncbi:hypothetical protein BDB01DRAFT_832943 [Pilobolus umbonatus]|nr:hypothetical protein BDB01DRAFT_832943 [Pilobolus umbonatus]
MHKRLDANDIQLTSVKELAFMTKELSNLLSTAQLRIAELESHLHQYTSSVPQSITKDIKDSSPSSSPNQKAIQSKSVSFSDVTNSTPISSYAAVASTPTPRRRTSVSKKAIARFITPVSPTHGFRYTYLNCRGRETISNVRSKLKTLGLQTNRILDIYILITKLSVSSLTMIIL